VRTEKRWVGVGEGSSNCGLRGRAGFLVSRKSCPGTIDLTSNARSLGSGVQGATPNYLDNNMDLYDKQRGLHITWMVPWSLLDKVSLVRLESQKFSKFVF
jgi:hypothetical protein